MAKEMVPIVLSCVVWRQQLSQKTVLLQCDNMGVIAVVKKGSSKEAPVMHLLRCLWFFVAQYNINLCIEHIAGISNKAADHMSCFNMKSFFLSNPQAKLLPTTLCN